MKIILILLIILIIYLLISYIFFLLTSRKSKKMTKLVDKMMSLELDKYKDLTKKSLEWMDKIPKKDLYIKSKDKLKLHAIYIDNPKSNKVLILIHGYRSTANRDVYPSCYNYYKEKCSLLIIDQRTSNLSEGKYITFGNKEKEDLSLWVDYIYKKTKKTIVLAGISMGATTSILASSINKKVKALMVDCGYINAYEELGYVIQKYFYISKVIFMPTINLYYKIITKTNLKDIDTIKALNKIDIPILLVHGKQDLFVPCNNTIHNYDSYHHKKTLLLVENADHGMSYLVEPKKYLNKIKNFLKEIE